jgi:hypothetical protein
VAFADAVLVDAGERVSQWLGCLFFCHFDVSLDHMLSRALDHRSWRFFLAGRASQTIEVIWWWANALTKNLGIDSTNAVNLVNIEPFHGYQSIPSQIPKKKTKKSALKPLK